MLVVGRFINGLSVGICSAQGTLVCCRAREIKSDRAFSSCLCLRASASE
jgi:hypothetical protein